jgi:diaminohydroxyphosphoribosylaminopyrimidine deaminase / 5-amino-6-(5-phosphoribosylamino)uracil reductase
LKEKVRVEVVPGRGPGIGLKRVLHQLGSEDVTSLLVEGGGEVNASFLFGGFAHRVAFFYAPKIIGGRDARHGVAGAGISQLSDALKLAHVEYRWLGEDLLMTGAVSPSNSSRQT